MDTKLVEMEDGIAANEGVTKATRSAIELAVLELIYQGHDRSFWVIKDGHRHPHGTHGRNEGHQIEDKQNEE